MTQTTQYSDKPQIAQMRGGEVVEVLKETPQPTIKYPAPKWVIVRMPDQTTRIMQRAALMMASKRVG